MLRRGCVLIIILKNVKLVKEDNTIISADIVAENGIIAEICEAADYTPGKSPAAGDEDTTVSAGSVNENSRAGNCEVIDCGGRLLMPGFIDAHVHLREPGFEQKETVRTGTMAAAAGGFTTVFPMPNLKPVPDNPDIMKEYIEKINREKVVNVLPYASITMGEKGQQVVDMKSLLSAGAIAFSDDGVGVQSDEVMLKAMKAAASQDTIIVAHTEDNSLKNAGCVHQGEYAEKMGWRGIPSACEYAQAERDIKLAEETGCRYHICHVSAKETIELVRKAKKEGLKVTCEITPHHLTLIDEDVKDANGKMNPPLRSRADRDALVEAIKDGTADIVATDHAPHTKEEKSRAIETAPFGIVGLETAFPVLYTKLVRTGMITLKRLQEVMSEVPAEIFGLKNTGRIKEGMNADLVLIDTDTEYSINPEEFKSMGKNTPYGGEKVFGKILLTMVGGNIVYDVR
ncbi:MAG: dihydroorotase [Bacillota bacterium]|nr:dihydroorotase [Bacillota bacterium]